MRIVKDWGTLIAVLLAITAGIYQYGRFEGRFEVRLDQLEESDKKINEKFNDFYDNKLKIWISENVQKYIGKDIIKTAQTNADYIKTLSVLADEKIRSITENKKKFDKVISKIEIPSGAVLAFNRKSCPTGWKPIKVAKGRVIVGAGRGKGLSERKLGDTGG
jgi:hypothetical protein